MPLGPGVSRVCLLEVLRLSTGGEWGGQPVPLEAGPPPQVPAHPGTWALTHLISEAPTATPGSPRGTSDEQALLLWWL